MNEEEMELEEAVEQEYFARFAAASRLDHLKQAAVREADNPGTESIWFVGWGSELVHELPADWTPPKRGYFTGLAERYQWEMECIREDGGFKRVFAQWLAGKCYSLAHWLETL